MTIKPIIYLLSFSLIAFSSCDDNASEPSKKPEGKTVNPTIDSTTIIDTKAERLAFDNLFANVPSPFIMARQIQSIGIEADISLLSNFEKASDYSTERKQALNLGVYSADLTYAHVLEIPAEEIKYFSAIAFLSEKLGIEKALNLEESIASFEEAEDDKAEALAIINDTYGDLESYLREEKREKIAAYMMAGGVVEMLFLATNTSTSNEDLLQVMADQSGAISSILGILERLGESEEDSVVIDLKKIQEIFSQMTQINETSSADNSEEDVVTLGGAPTLTLSENQAKTLKVLVGNLRVNYTE